MPDDAYRLAPSEPLADEIRRVALGRIDHALGELRDGADSAPEEAVHEARKDLKKLRSLLRLARGGLDAKAYRRERAVYREAGRELSGTRDSDVLIPTLECLDLDSAVAGPLLQALEAHRLRLARGPSIERVAAWLAEARERVGSWTIHGDSFDALEPGLVRAQLRGRRAMRRARKAPSTESFHEWRKRAKDLWYHQLLLQELWPPVIDAFADEAHHLSDRLGDDHDLAMLLEWAHEHAEAPPQLIQAAEGRRAELQADAFAFGARLYADRPGAFVRRYERWWKAAAREVASGVAAGGSEGAG